MSELRRNDEVAAHAGGREMSGSGVAGLWPSRGQQAPVSAPIVNLSGYPRDCFGGVLVLYCLANQLPDCGPKPPL